MSVIPVTLAISLGLLVLFIVLFMREHRRSRLSSPDRDALLPLADEKPRVSAGREDGTRVISFAGRDPGAGRRHADGSGCGGDGRGRCPDCSSR